MDNYFKDLFSKKLTTQDDVPTFFDKAVKEHISNINSDNIDYLNMKLD